MDQTRPSTSEDQDPTSDDTTDRVESMTPADAAPEAGEPVAEPAEAAQDDAPADAPDVLADEDLQHEREVREQEAAATIEAAPFEPALGEITGPSDEPGDADDAVVPEEPVAEEPVAEEPVAEEPAEQPATAAVDEAVEAAEPDVEEPDAEAVVEEAESIVARADEDEVAEEEVDAETAALLAWQPGEWFVVHTYAGYENKVKANLETRIMSMNMEDRIYEVVIPMEDVVEMKGGKKQVVQRKVFPGYLLVRMDLDDDSWYVVRNTPGVTGFVGSTNRPIPLSDAEVDRILQRGAAAEEERPRPRPEWQVNDPVRVTTGPFANFQGVVSEIDLDRSKLKVLVNIFGRETPVELGFDQVSKV